MIDNETKELKVEEKQKENVVVLDEEKLSSWHKESFKTKDGDQVSKLINALVDIRKSQKVKIKLEIEICNE